MTAKLEICWKFTSNCNLFKINFIALLLQQQKVIINFILQSDLPAFRLLLSYVNCKVSLLELFILYSNYIVSIKKIVTGR